MAEFDAILFDAGGVLVVPAPADLAPVISPFGARTEPEILVRAHFAGAHAMDLARSDGLRADWDAYTRGYLAAAGVAPRRLSAAAAAMVAEFDHWMWRQPLPGAREALAALVGHGIPIGIVSNAAGQVEGELDRLGICRAVPAGERCADGVRLTAGSVPTGEGPVPVACVVDSHVVGVAKPDPAIFDAALAALGVPASPRVAYVGDTVFYDVRAALAAGLSPLLHDPFGFHAADPHPSGPHRRLLRLADLVPAG